MRSIKYLLVMGLLNQFLFSQDHIHWGSTGDPLNGLTITWHASSLSSTGDQFKWGYTAAYEQGSFFWIVNNIFFQYYSLIIFVVSVFVMFVVSYVTEEPDYTKKSGLTFGTLTKEHIDSRQH